MLNINSELDPNKNVEEQIDVDKVIGEEKDTVDVEKIVE